MGRQFINCLWSTRGPFYSLFHSFSFSLSLVFLSASGILLRRPIWTMHCDIILPRQSSGNSARGTACLPRFPCRHPRKPSLISTFAVLFIRREETVFGRWQRETSKYRVSRDAERIISLGNVERKRVEVKRVVNDILQINKASKARHNFKYN